MSSKLQLDVCCLSCGGAIWWTLTKERQAWCCLQVILCDPCLSALKVCVRTKMALYKYPSFPFVIWVDDASVLCVQAYFSGQMKLSGNLGLAMQLDSILRPLQTLHSKLWRSLLLAARLFVCLSLASCVLFYLRWLVVFVRYLLVVLVVSVHNALLISYYTPCLKKTSQLWLAITLTVVNGFWYFLAEMLPIK